MPKSSEVGQKIPGGEVIAGEIRARHRSCDQASRAITALPGYRLSVPIPITIERDGKSYLVSDDVFNRYAVGRSLDEACQVLSASIADYFRTLEEESRRLSRGAQEDFDLMRRYLSSSSP